MYIIIVGAGKVGYHLARYLLAEGHEVMLAETVDLDVAHDHHVLGVVVEQRVADDLLGGLDDVLLNGDDNLFDEED